MKDTVTFSIDIAGDSTGKQWSGLFTARTTLSYSEMFREDEIRRRFLGADPANADPFIDQFARRAAAVAVRISEAPDWFKQSDCATSGLPGRDLNVLTEISRAMSAAVKVETDAAAAAAAAAQPALKEMATKAGA